jgi:hypothetical protein
VIDSQSKTPTYSNNQILTRRRCHTTIRRYICNAAPNIIRPRAGLHNILFNDMPRGIFRHRPLRAFTNLISKLIPPNARRWDSCGPIRISHPFCFIFTERPIMFGLMPRQDLHCSVLIFSRSWRPPENLFHQASIF